MRAFTQLELILSQYCINAIDNILLWNAGDILRLFVYVIQCVYVHVHKKYLQFRYRDCIKSRKGAS